MLFREGKKRNWHELFWLESKSTAKAHKQAENWVFKMLTVEILYMFHVGFFCALSQLCTTIMGRLRNMFCCDQKTPLDVPSFAFFAQIRCTVVPTGSTLTDWTYKWLHLTLNQKYVNRLTSKRVNWEICDLQMTPNSHLLWISKDCWICVALFYPVYFQHAPKKMHVFFRGM